MRYGYIRVSTQEQNIDRQLSAMRENKIAEKNIYIDKVSGKNFDRKAYKKLMRKIQEEDQIYVKSIDRFGRNYDEIIEEWNFITKVKKANIIVIDFPLLDTRSQVNTLTGKFLADIVLQVLSYIAQIERENIHQRQREGIAEAKKKGIQFGRPHIKRPQRYPKIASAWKNGEISLREGATMLGISHSTFYSWIKEDKN